MGKLILAVEEDEMSLFKKQYLSVLELQEEIEKRLEKIKSIDKRKKKIYNQARKDVNFLIDMYNTKAKFKSYNRI